MSKLWLTLALLLAGCATSKLAPPIKAVATREEIMHHLVIPNAQRVWASVGSTSTVEGTVEKQPKTDDEWFDVESAATILMESGNLLMMDGRAMDSGKWIEYSKMLRDTADTVRLAAKKHDPAGVFDRGGDMFESCQGCHFAYRFEKDPKTIRSH